MPVGNMAHSGRVTLSGEFSGRPRLQLNSLAYSHALAYSVAAALQAVIFRQASTAPSRSAVSYESSLWFA